MSLVYLNVCRLCAGSCKNSVLIFEETGILNVAEKIKSYLHIEIKNLNDANDEPRMCNSCYNKIRNWDQYAKKVQKVQGMFMSLTEEKDNIIMQKMCQEVLNEKDEFFENSEKFLIQELVENNEENSSKEKRKGKKKSKKVKTVDAQDKNSDFSEEDDIPLANQIGFVIDAVRNRPKKKEGKKVKPRIKLKIKAVKEKEGYGSVEISNDKGTSDCSEIKDLDEHGENGMDDNGVDSKDENKLKMSGLQSLFTWECLECHTLVKNWNALVKHCRDVHDINASVQCVCGKFLQSRASIMKHRMKHTVGYEYKCDFENCNKTFHRQQHLDVHSLSHMPKELQPWMCCKCSRRFHTESLLKQHEKVHLPKEEKLIHPCEVCQKKFCSKSAVSAHIRAVHFGERPFVCDQCGHSFTSKGILHEHLTIHSDVCNFHCKECNKSFKTKYRLKIHMDTHVETRYQCPICTLTLNTRRTLRMHLLVHRDDKAFQCTTCGKAFKRSKDLKNHYNLHTGRRPYVCPFCQRTFANGSNCRSHKRRMHPEELKMYEAALAAGQQPLVFRMENQDAVGRTNGLQHQFPEDSNGSQSDFSDMKPENRKYSDEDEKPVSLVPCKGVANGCTEDIDKYKMLSSGSVPLNLQGDYARRIKKEDEGKQEDGEEEGMETIEMNGEDNIAANLAQIAFGSQPQSVQYPVHNFYSFQSSGIPAFPGNPFFRQ